MESGVYISESEMARKIYNICLKEGLTKKEISIKLYDKWIPNAVIPTLEKLVKSGAIEFREIGKNIQRKRGKYHSIMLPLLEVLKTRSEPSLEERAFLESESFKKEFFRINGNLRLEDDWIRPLLTFLEDLLIFQIVTARRNTKNFVKDLKTSIKLEEVRLSSTKLEEARITSNKLGNVRNSSKDIERNLTKPSDIMRNRTLSYESVQNNMQLNAAICSQKQSNAVISSQKHANTAKSTKMHANVHNCALMQLIAEYDTVIQEMLGKYGEQYEIVWKNRKFQGQPTKSLLRTDHLCLSLLMPESLVWRIKFSSPRREIFGLIERM